MVSNHLREVLFMTKEQLVKRATFDTDPKYFCSVDFDVFVVVWWLVRAQVPSLPSLYLCVY